MTAIALCLTMNTLKKSDNLKFITLGLITCVLIFYFKDLSLALGQTDRIPLNFSYLGASYCFKFIHVYRGSYKLMKNRLIIIFLFLLSKHCIG